MNKVSHIRWFNASCHSRSELHNRRNRNIRGTQLTQFQTRKTGEKNEHPAH
jgi:hypothetical protein